MTQEGTNISGVYLRRLSEKIRRSIRVSVPKKPFRGVEKATNLSGEGTSLLLWRHVFQSSLLLTIR
jgi:hypothetical protein